ncbi:MAG: 50S ribosomal protein L9 [Alphaproteobacteria bacterium]
MSTQVILLQRVAKLGQMGDVVTVKPGYARNYLLPQGKALRASKNNIAYFDAQKKVLQEQNDKSKKDAEKLAKKIDGLKVPLIRAASESGQLYGSVNTRDIAQAAAEVSGEAITRPMVKINTNFKTIGLFPVSIQLHPEVIVEITTNIARSTEEAKIQAETGKALVASDDRDEPEEEAPTGIDEEALADVLEEDALEAEKTRAADAEVKAAEDAAKAEEKAAKKAEKEAAKAAEEPAEDAEEAPVEMGATEE